jgi:YggT family protein
MAGIFLQIFDIFYYAILILLLARAVLSWVNIGGYKIRDLVFRLTEPILAPVRRYLPMSGGVDFSPLIVFFGLALLRNVLIRIIF